jgi:HAD superfamily hydrolase (TIGR01549 family)
MKPLTVFFDVGGTLLDSPDLFVEITNNLTSKGDDETTRDLIQGIIMKLFLNVIRRDPFLNVEKVVATTLALIAKDYNYPDISARARDIYYDVFLYRSSLFPEIIYVLDNLHRNDVRMIIASDADSELMKEELVKHNLKKYFVDICTSDLVKAYKPANKFLSYLKKYTSQNEENCYFVGDNNVDIECGKQLGIKSVLIDRKNRINKMSADYIIRDLNELLPILGLE